MVHNDSFTHDVESRFVIDENFAGAISESRGFNATNETILVPVEGIALGWGCQEASKSRNEQIQVNEPAVFPARHSDNNTRFRNDEVGCESSITTYSKNVENKAG